MKIKKLRGGPEVKLAEEKDLILIANCHIACFPNSFSSKLGAEFVAKSFEPFIYLENAFILFIEEDGECTGYINGLVPKEFGSASTMLQSSLFVGLKAIIRRPWLLFDKQIYARYKMILRNIFYKIFNRKVRKKNETEIPKSFGLPAMCVHPKHIRKGHYIRLMEAAERKVKEHGYDLVHCSVLKTNPIAYNSHLRIGWKIDKDDGVALFMSKHLV